MYKDLDQTELATDKKINGLLHGILQEFQLG